jgi:tripartite-type tricarboxylate transporter receptor subunit TctC
VLSLVLATGALMAAAASAGAQAYPERPIRIIVPYGGGGAMDRVARVLADELKTSLGVAVYVENHGGAAGTIGLDLLARAAADGYTLGLGSASTLAVVPATRKDLRYDPRTSFAPVGLVGVAPFFVAVSSATQIATLDELVRFGRAHPGKLNFASVGDGSITHFAGEQFKALARVDAVHVPYASAGRARVDLLAGRVQLMFDQLATFRGGALESAGVRLLAVMATRRHPQVPSVPTVAEAGLPDLLGGTWFGLLAPAGTPQHVISRLNATLQDALRSQPIGRAFEAEGLAIEPGSPDAMARRIAADIETWSRIAGASGFASKTGH